MLGSDAGQASSSAVRAGTALRSASGRKCWSRAAACLVQRLALQPDAHEPAAMHGQGIKGGETLVGRRGAWGKRRATPDAGRLACAVERIDELADYALDTKASEHSVYPRLFVWNLVERRRLYLQNPKGLIFPVFWLAGG